MDEAREYAEGTDLIVETRGRYTRCEDNWCR